MSLENTCFLLFFAASTLSICWVSLDTLLSPGHYAGCLSAVLGHGWLSEQLRTFIFAQHDTVSTLLQKLETAGCSALHLSFEARVRLPCFVVLPRRPCSQRSRIGCPIKKPSTQDETTGRKTSFNGNESQGKALICKAYADPLAAVDAWEAEKSDKRALLLLLPRDTATQ